MGRHTSEEQHAPRSKPGDEAGNREAMNQGPERGRGRPAHASHPAKNAPKKRRTVRSAEMPSQVDLRSLVDRGAALRRHRFLADVRTILPLLLISGAAQSIVYALFFARATRWSWSDLIGTVAILFIGSLFMGLLLAGLRRTRFPFTAAFAVAFVVYNFEVVILAAWRLPLSYWGLLAAGVLALLGAVIANLRLHRGSRDRVGILDFVGADGIAQLMDGVPEVIRDPGADTARFDIILYEGATHHVKQWSKLLTRAHMQGAQLMPWISYLELRHGRVDIEAFDISHLSYTPSQIYFVRCKRAFDLILLALSLPLTVPLGTIIWCYIKVIDPSHSPFFVQTRRGYGGRNFRMYKFRTMHVGTHGGAAQDRDRRVMPGCHFLRRTRLDELPQLINIWRGQMSWVGPRPESIELARRYEAEIPQYIYRLLVLPGLTGWAQVSNGYTSNAIEARVKLAYDLYYLKNISFDLEIEILLRTVRTLLTRKGAR